MKESGKRILFWGILWLFALLFGITGFIISGDYKDMKLFEGLFPSNNDGNTDVEKANVDLKYLSDELNNYFDGAFGSNDYVGISSVIDDTISVSLSGATESLTFDYKLNGTILSCDIPNDPTDNGEIIFKKLVAIIESKYYSISEADVMNTFNSDDINSYTLATNNIEINKTIGFSGKINVNKAITIVSTPSYVNESMLQNSTTFMDENEISRVNTGNIILYKSKVNGNINLSIFEKDALTENSYKTLVSAITVLYGTAEANLFKVSYPNLSTTDYSFDTYDIKIKPTFTENEKAIADPTIYQLVRIVIK
jgi:hypothetical protein